MFLMLLSIGLCLFVLAVSALIARYYLLFTIKRICKCGRCVWVPLSYDRLDIRYTRCRKCGSRWRALYLRCDYDDETDMSHDVFEIRRRAPKGKPRAEDRYV